MLGLFIIIINFFFEKRNLNTETWYPKNLLQTEKDLSTA